MQIQLLARDDISTDDAQTLTDRWRQYIESYTLVCPPTTSRIRYRVLTRLLSFTAPSDRGSPRIPSPIPAEVHRGARRGRRAQLCLARALADQSLHSDISPLLRCWNGGLLLAETPRGRNRGSAQGGCGAEDRAQRCPRGLAGQ